MHFSSKKAYFRPLSSFGPGMKRRTAAVAFFHQFRRPAHNVNRSCTVTDHKGQSRVNALVVGCRALEEADTSSIRPDGPVRGRGEDQVPLPPPQQIHTHHVVERGLRSTTTIVALLRRLRRWRLRWRLRRPWRLRQRRRDSLPRVGRHSIRHTTTAVAAGSG
eukprot:COSAG01_NODE_2186_length_8202_cov_5.667407_3_plen_162_part_00